MLSLAKLQVEKERSLDQSGYNLSILFTVVHSYEVNCHQTKILASDCIATAFTMLLNPFQTLKVVSLDQSVFNLIILFIAIQLYVIKLPQTKVFPSDCIAIAFTVLLKPFQIVKVVSLDQSELSLTILFIENQLYEVNHPQTKIFPSA
jgi:hypothetical protein